MEIFEWTEQTPVTANNLNEMQNIINNNIETADVYGNNYVKMIDGTLICWGTVAVGNVSPTSDKAITINLPQNYIDTNYSCMVTKKGTGAYWSMIVETVASITNSSVSISIWNNSNSQATVPAMDYITVGKWK